MSRTKGKIIIPAGLDVWEHELRTAKVFAQHGHVVEFIAIDPTERAKTPDIQIDKIAYEIKSPKADKLSAVERNLKRAARQSGNIIIDSRRMSKIHDSTIQKFLVQKFKQQKSIKRLLFVNRKHQIVDISRL